MENEERLPWRLFNGSERTYALLLLLAQVRTGFSAGAGCECIADHAGMNE